MALAHKHICTSGVLLKARSWSAYGE